MRLQDMQQVTVRGNYRQLYNAFWERPAVHRMRELDRTSQNAMDFPQFGIPRMHKVTRDGAKSRFVSLHNTLVSASAMNSENWRRGSSNPSIGRCVRTISFPCREISRRASSLCVSPYRTRYSRAVATVVEEAAR